jgi:Delta24-sterol reductase
MCLIKRHHFLSESKLNHHTLLCSYLLLKYPLEIAMSRHAARHARRNPTRGVCQHQRHPTLFSQQQHPYSNAITAQFWPQNLGHRAIHFSPNMETHEAAVQCIADQIRAFYNRKEPFRINHGSTNSTRHLQKGSKTIDTSALSNVVSIDVANKWALVEPNVPMDRLVEATLKHGLVPPVVMEFPGITAGGGFAGTSGESSSFKHGFFDRTLKSVEIVLADGEVVRASESNCPDLFRGAAGAMGTLGVTTMIELSLVKAKRWVRVAYHPVTKGMSEAVEILERVTKEPGNDYVDGIMFSKEQGAILVGTLTDEKSADEKIQRFSRPWDPWYYLHVQSRLKSVKRTTTSSSSDSDSTAELSDLVPLADYLFRYDRGGFWVGRGAFSFFGFPFNRLTRWFLDDFMHTRMLYRALHASKQSMSYVVQDLALPYSTVAQFVEYTDQAFDIYPLWLCPLKQSPLPTFHPHNAKEVDTQGSLKPLLNIGLWGWGPRSDTDFLTLNRQLEHKLRSLGGMKWFYAQCYYPEAEFWTMYDKTWYEGLRKKYRAEFLPSVWQKVHVDVEREEEVRKTWKVRVLRIWPFAGVWGLWKAIWSWDWSAKRRVQVWKLEVKGKGKQE